MTHEGSYRTLDGKEYRVYKRPASKGIEAAMMCQCLKCTVRQGPFEPFQLRIGQVERNLKANIWTKIDQ